ncbi:MAG: hypothetical protein Q8O05_03605 [Chloroflexota bacterium]|nr:hypothetical protein [Chloroflexota bacterium]
MGTKAYFMVNMDRKYSQDGHYLDAVSELEAMPEVESVETVSGVCDLLVKVDAPLRVISVANKISARKWVKSLHVLKVEYAEPAEVPQAVTPESVKAEATLPR